MDHQLVPYFSELRRFESTRELKSSRVYARLGGEIERVLGRLLKEDWGIPPAAARKSLRVTAWNIQRGIQLERIIQALETHPVMSQSDVFLLTELDHGMARSQNLAVAREIARALGLNLVFAPCYLSLVNGSGVEYSVEGENEQGIHGNALLSRYPILEAHAVPLRNGKDLIEGKEKRLGQQQAVVGVVDHPLGRLRCVCLHLDAHSSRRHRRKQMQQVLDHVEALEPRLPVLLGGDWNTSTYNSQRAYRSILGYWRRVFMGPGRVIRKHFPYPDRWFERGLFRELERRGYGYREFNQPGGCTIHYDVEDILANTDLADWIPNWCFWFIRQALKPHQGRCSLKLDWFAGKRLSVAPGQPPRVIQGLDPERPMSDHDPIVVDVVPAKTASTAGSEPP